VTGRPPYTLYVYCLDIGGKGHAPERYSITMARYMNCFNLQGGRSHIRIENMTLRYTTDNGVACGTSVGCELRDLDVYGHRITGIYFLDAGNRGNLVEGCQFAGNGHCGVELTTGRDLTVRRCRFHWMGEVRGGNSTHIAFPSTGGEKSDVVIENCLFERTGSNYGKLEHGIALFGTSVDGLTIRHNTFYDWTESGFLCASGAGDYTIAANIFYSDASQRFIAFGSHMSPTPTGALSLLDNVFYGATTHDAYRWGAADSPSFADFEARVKGSGGAVSGNRFDDPRLSDRAAYDLRLTPGSPCVDAARPAGTTDSYDGTRRPPGAPCDIGAYESRPR